jgi:hypothetical protein
VPAEEVQAWAAPPGVAVAEDGDCFWFLPTERCFPKKLESYGNFSCPIF